MENTITKILIGHSSPETAYLVDDYPYGFRLRCKIRYWIETTKSGQRLCTQTTNPKKSGEVWNTPKKSTYTDLKVLTLNEDNHIRTQSFNIAYDAEKIESFVERFNEALQDEYSQKTIKSARLIAKTREEMRKLVLESTNGASDNIYDAPKEKQAYIVTQAKASALKELGV